MEARRDARDMTDRRHSIYIMAVCCALAWLMVGSSCSTSQNTPMTRFYHSFTARYNTYFNGHEAFKAGVAAQDAGNQDNFTEMLPVFAVSNTSTASMGKSNFETAIEKCEKAIKNHSIKRRPKINRNRRSTPKQKRMLAKREYNPFLKNAWMLMGEAQFRKGDFVEAASTFSYINRLYAAEPDVLAESRAWLAACYSELDWFYDAEDIFRNKIGRDSVPHSARKTLDAAYADFYARQGKYQEALPYLLRTARRTKGAAAKARLYFLLGQIYNEQGDKRLAYKSFSKVVRQSPPYEVQLNARVMQAEVVSQSKAKPMLARLNRMAKKSKNLKYCDQIYYAIGNIHLAKGDTSKAITAYETGVSKATRSGLEKGALLLRLAELYAARYDFASCRRCIDKGVGMINKERKDYDSIQAWKGIIDELEPHTTAVAGQDSVRALAKMPEAERNAVFDKAIELEKKRLREERKKAAAEGRKGSTGTRGQNNRDRQDDSQAAAKQQGKKDDKAAWYFYNQQAVENGKAAFERQWGTRELADNWRRSNKELANADNGGVADGGDGEAKPNDSTAAKGSQPSDSTAKARDGKGKDGKGKEKTDKRDKDNEKLTREYYQNQLPQTDEQIAESDKKIMEGLHKAGVIEKDRLGDLPLAERTLTRLYTEYPDYSGNDDVLYQLFLLESQMGHTAQAELYKNALAQRYADGKLAKLVTDPNYEYDAKFGKQMEDSLYAATYDAFRAGDVATVARNAGFSATRFPDGDNRAKFIFLGAFSSLRNGDRQAFANDLDTLVAKYPKDEITPLAQSILKGLKAGRVPGSGAYDIGSLWSRRANGDAAFLDSLALSRQLSPARDTAFNVIIAYPADSIDENKLLYDVARYNFTNFSVRNFEIEQTTQEGLGEMIVSGFSNFDEAHSYAQMLYNNATTRQYFPTARLIVISQANLEKLGVDFSIADYQNFYDKTFAPIKIKPGLRLDKQIDIYQSEDELPSGGTDVDEGQEQEQPQDDNSYPDDTQDDTGDDDWYNIE